MWIVRSGRVLRSWVHLHVSLATVWPRLCDLRSISDFIVLERIEVILDVDGRALLDGARAKEGIRRDRFCLLWLGRSRCGTLSRSRLNLERRGVDVEAIGSGSSR